MRVLHVLDHSIPIHSGYSFRTRAILDHQRRLGWRTAHVTSSKHDAAASEVEENVDGLVFCRTPKPTGWLTEFPIFSQYRVIQSLSSRLDEVITKEQPDILHAHSPALNGVAGLRAGRKHGLPVVYECRAFWEDAAVDHGTSKERSVRYRLTRALETLAFRRSAAVTTICEGLRTEIIDRGLSPEKVTVIPNAVDLRQFSTSRRPDPGLSDALRIQDKTVLGFIGSFYAYEGLPLLLHALPTILDHAPDIRLLLIGGGPQEEALRALSQDLGLSEHVLFTGRIAHRNIACYYDLIDILIYPRLSMRLTELVTPLKPLEAMAQGKLVLASDVGGHRELIQDHKTGVLFPAGDSKALSHTIIELLKNRTEWPRLQAAARRFVEQQRSWEASVARYGPIYERLCSKPGLDARSLPAES
jgi:PEP-CTERM/exosortase A-associated glycosyltransferase